MQSTIYYDRDADPIALQGSVIAIVGYGAQGQAHALNLRDSGCNVLIGQRTGGRGWADAQRDGFEPTPIIEAVRNASIVCLMIPDEFHKDVFSQSVLPHTTNEFTILTCHGFSFHYGLIPRDARYRRLLVAPKGQGNMVRSEFAKGGGVPCLLAVDSPEEIETLKIGLAYAQAIGGTRAGVIRTTFAAETETDLFGEQAVLCGGLTQLIQAGFETLVGAGYQPELAYFECLHELKIIVDLLHTKGIAAMRDVISTTAEYGDITRGPRVIDGHVRHNMEIALREIQSGDFAKEFLKSQSTHSPILEESRLATSQLLIETVGQKLRGMMPWINRQE